MNKQRIWLVWGNTGSYETTYHVVAAYTDRKAALRRREELNAVVGAWWSARNDLPTPDIEDTPENDRLHEQWNRALKRMERKYRREGKDPSMDYDTTYTVGTSGIVLISEGA